MRIGGHLGLSGPDKPLLAHLARSTAPVDQVAALAANGLVGVQDLALKLRGAQEVSALAEAMAARGLVLTSLGGNPLDWNTPLWSRTDAASRAAQDLSVAQSAALAARFGGAGAVCVAGLDPDRPRSSQIAAMTENLRRAGDRAAEGGLVLLVEPIAAARIPGLLLDQLEQGAEIVSAVALPSVRLTFDIGHVAMMGLDVPDALRACRDLVGLVQATDVRGTDRVDPGLGTLDWPAITAALAETGYAGVIEMEFEPAEPGAAGEEAMLRRIGRIFGG